MRRNLPMLAAGLAAALTLSACGSTLSGSAAGAAGANDPARPNIVFVLTDDLSMNLIGHMPNVRALQRDGTTMSRNYVVDSLCCPSRSATFTGEYPHDDGVFTNTGSDGGYAAYNANGNPKKSFAVSLHANGYRTGFMGKYLNGYQPTDPVPTGWDEWDVAGNGYPEFDYDLNQNGTVHHYGKRPQDYLTDVLSRKASSFISSSRKPFALEVATFAPHAPYTPAPRDVGSAKNVAYPRTTAYDTLPTAPPSWLAGRPGLTSAQKTQLLTAYRKRVAAVQSVDDLIGHLRAVLEAKGVARNTYVVFSSDNGYHMGEYRLLAGKQTAFDTDVHVPLVVAGPKVPAGHVNDQLVSNVDLAPTFESVTGSRVGASVDGVNMAALWHGARPAGWKKSVLIEHHGPDQAKDDPDRQTAPHANPPSYEAVRTSTALYVKYGNGQQEYYDTTKDPSELHNLAARGVPSALPRTLTALVSCHGSAACRKAAG